MVEPPPERREGEAVDPVADKRPALLAIKSLLRDPPRSDTEKETPWRLLTKGAERLKLGLIGATRLCFERVYDMGLPVGALEYAATHDPYELDLLQARGAAPDRSEARKWYGRAIKLGSREADERPQRMERFSPLR